MTDDRVSPFGGGAATAAGGAASRLANGAAAAGGIGHKLRLRRKVRGLSLREIADRSGLSIGLVSQIERGLTTPSLRSLKQICAALDMPIRWLFDTPDGADAGEDDVVVRANQRRHLDFGSKGMTKELMSPDSVPGIQMMRLILQPGGSSGESPYNHPSGAKCGTVIAGEFGLEVDGRRHHLMPNDSFAFHATARHRFWCIGDQPCEVLWIVSPAVY